MDSAFTADIWSGSRCTFSPKNYTIVLFLILGVYILMSSPKRHIQNLCAPAGSLDWYFLLGASKRLCSRLYCALWITFLLSVHQMHKLRWKMQCTYGTVFKNSGSDPHNDEIAYYILLHEEMNHIRLWKSLGLKMVRGWENVWGRYWIYLPCSYRSLGICLWTLLGAEWLCVLHMSESVWLYLYS